MFALLQTGAPAQAALYASSCADIKSLNFTQPDYPGPSNQLAFAALQVGDTITFNYSTASGIPSSISIAVTDAPAGASTGTFVTATPTGSHTLSPITVAGQYEITFSTQAMHSVNYTHTCVNVPQGPSASESSDAASAAQGALDAGRMNNAASNLPGSGPSSSGSTGPLGYAPSSSNPVNDAFLAINAHANGLESSSFVDRIGVDVWTRLKLSLIDGALGRRGSSIQGQIGVVHALSDTLDAGAFASLFAGNITDGPLTATLSSIGIGGGVYFKLDHSDTLQSGLSASFERSSNDISITGNTGTYLSDRLEVDYALSGDYFVEDLHFMPVFNLDWVHTQRQSYVDSAATTVPGQATDEVTASGGLTLDRTFVVDQGSIVALTPSIGGAVNFHLLRLSDLTFAGVGTISQSPISGSAHAGISAQLMQGAALDANVRIDGIGNNTQAYSASLGLSAPLN